MEELAKQRAQMVTLLITKLQLVFSDVVKSNHFITKIFHQYLVFKYVQGKAMHIIKIRLVYIQVEEFQLVLEPTLLIGFQKVV